MFFNISLCKQDNFPLNYYHNNLVINLDHGWSEGCDDANNKIFYKGYLDQYPIEDMISNISQQQEPLYTGNFCLIKCSADGISVKTDRFRSFPIWYNKTSLTNLTNNGQSIYTDRFITLTNEFELIESKFSLINKIILNKNLSMDDCVNQIDNILTKKISTFFETNKLPLHVFLSGGIDTTTLYSYILKLNIPHVLVNYYHTDLDYFYLKNHGTIGKFWGYRQIHYWAKPCLLLSGAPGDEYTVRSPTTANMLLKYYDTSIDNLLDQKKDSLHYKYFMNYLELFRSQSQLKFKNLEYTIRQCLNIILNDYQHWHLGSTLSYTPLRDVDIFKTIASLSKDDLIEQVFDSKIQKELIKKNAPHLIDCLSFDKNTDNFMENLTNIYNLPLQDSTV
jgi:hypothetical protein